MLKVDLNCDMGESFGAWTLGNDAALMEVVSSINVACGFHAGDATVMRQTVETAVAKNVAIGAHPSFPDLQGFGRREMSLSPKEIFDVTLYQVSALQGIIRAHGGKLHHVKPHGALYNSAAKSAEKAAAIACAVKMVDQDLILYGLSGSALISEAEKIGLRTASEVFADRTYQADGSLTSRAQPNALIEDAQTAVAQVLEILAANMVTATNGTKVQLKAETICLHGDSIHALRFAQAIRESLSRNDVLIEPL
ncbi:MAG: 5-oxoprolinase subunit PxpA [Pyrinomonadaceae bacterium]